MLFVQTNKYCDCFYSFCITFQPRALVLSSDLVLEVIYQNTLPFEERIKTSVLIFYVFIIFRPRRASAGPWNLC